MRCASVALITCGKSSCEKKLGKRNKSKAEMDMNARCAEGKKRIENKKREKKEGGIKMCRFRCDKSIILSTIPQHSKSPSGTFFFFFCNVSVHGASGAKGWELITGSVHSDKGACRGTT